MPASSPSSAASDRGLVHRRQRPRAQLARAPARAAGRRRRSRRRRRRSRRARRCWRSWRRATPSRPPIRSKTPIAVSSPASAASVTALPSISSPSASSLPRAESGLAFGRRARPRGRAPCPRRASRRSRGRGSCPGRAARRSRSRCGRARRRRRSSRGRSRRRGSGRRRSRCRSSASPRCRRPGRRRRGARRARRRWRRCRRRPAARSARRPGRGSAGSSIGRLTAETATPRSWSIVAGIPSPTAATSGRASRASSISRTSSSTSSSSVWPVEASRLSQRTLGRRRGRRRSIFVPPRSTPIVSPRAHALGCGRLGGGATAGIGMISSPFMPDDGEQRPSGPPEYKVYRPAGASSRACAGPDLSEPARPREGCPASGPAAASADAPRRAGRRAPGVTGRKRVLKWVGIAACGWILLSFLAFARLRPAAVVQALRRSEGRPARQPLPAAQRRRRSSSSAPTPAPPDTKEPGAPHSQKCFEQQSHGDAPHDGCRSRRIPRRHADADPGRRRHLPQTLDPARHLRRNPRPERRRKSTPPTPSAAPRCRSRRSKSSSGSRSTTSRSSTSPASKT